jgi:DNA repair exonuclease SbcCD ATPase subunit
VCPSCTQAFTDESHKKSALSDLYNRIQDFAQKDTAAAQREVEQYATQVEATQSELAALQAPDSSLLHDLQAAIASCNTKKQTLTDRIAEARVEEVRYGSYMKALTIWETNTQSLKTTLEDKQGKLRPLEALCSKAQCDLLALQIQTLQKTQEAACKELTGFEESYKRFAEALVQKSLLEKTLSEIHAQKFPQLQELETAERKKKEVEDKLKSLASELVEKTAQIRVLENCSTAFGDQGIVSELFREYIPALQALSSDYLAAITNDELRVEFLPEKELKTKDSKGSQVIRNQFAINVSMAQGGGSYATVSGSEQNKASLICSCALSDLAHQFSNVSCNLRVFDEVLDSMDAVSSERMIAFLNTHNFDRTVFIISHDSSIEDSVMNKISLTKKNGITTLD